MRPGAEAGCVQEDLRAGLSFPLLYTRLCLHSAQLRLEAWPEKAVLGGGEFLCRASTNQVPFLSSPFLSPQAGSLGLSLFIYTVGLVRAASGGREHPLRHLEMGTVPLMRHLCENQGCPMGPLDCWF